MTKEVNKIVKSLKVYRYASLTLTSIFYIIGIYEETIMQRIVFITAMFIMAFVLDDLYRRHKESKKKVCILVTTEILWNCLLLLGSGGLESPYVWYSINTLFIVAATFDFKYLWANVALYMGHMCVASWWLASNHTGLLESLNVIVGFVLVALAIHMLAERMKALHSRNKRFEQYLYYAMHTYETVYIATSQETLTSWANVILDYMTQTLGAPKALIVHYDQEIEDKHYSRGMDVREEAELLRRLRAGHKYFMYQEGELCYDQDGFIGMPIQYSHECLGVIVMQKKEYQKCLEFLTSISGMLLKKIELETMHRELVLNHEHNRIANEIHDSVLQQLFGISCQAFTLESKLHKLDTDEIQQELNGMRLQMKQAMSDLRSMIYGMSWQKEGTNSFLEKLKSYMERLEKQHGVQIVLNVQGDAQYLGIEEQKMLYRICCEAVSNGIRHGKAVCLTLYLKMSNETIYLVIEDDGKGFDYEETIKSGKVGLGLRNMQQMVQERGGQLVIESHTDKGTRVEVRLPQNIK